jgi:tetratricopeptide (TPR) repeat protein
MTSTNELIVRSAGRSRDLWSFAFLEFFGRTAITGRCSRCRAHSATATEAGFVAAVAALEHAGGAREARESYLALLARWPASEPGLIGLGNTEYALKDLAGAERAFRRASEVHPGSVTALNNLAHVLAAQGRYEEAEAAARRAVAQAGPLQPQARKTLEEILQRR